jgi:hypothetical protein
MGTTDPDANFLRMDLNPEAVRNSPNVLNSQQIGAVRPPIAEKPDQAAVDCRFQNWHLGFRSEKLGRQSPLEKPRF